MPSKKPINEAWTLDQLAKSLFFHQKIHEWKLISTSQAIDEVKGENLTWELSELAISELAWNKIIHAGIKPITVFAHPDVLATISKAVAYYRMLAMVSQKSMTQVGLATQRYESQTLPDQATSLVIAKHLNFIISKLIEADEPLDKREFDLWRGMAAGSQAQGSWQNTKGSTAELVVQGILRQRLEKVSLLFAEQTHEQQNALLIKLNDGRLVQFADDPDVAVFKDNLVQAAIEIKGGIDKAGILERLGATIKSLQQVKNANPQAVTILILQKATITDTALKRLEHNKKTIDYWFTIEDILEDTNKTQEIFNLLNI